MHQLELSLKVVRPGEKNIIDGIIFEGASFVRSNFFPDLNRDLEEALIVFSELCKTIGGNGKYLIFTGASGVADEGGWSGVDVHHEGKIIVWDFWAGDNKYHLEFDRQEYQYQIELIGREIERLPAGVILEPSQLFYPEEW